MKLFIFIVTIVVHFSVYANTEHKIKNWNQNLEISAQKAYEIIYNYYIDSVRWEDEGIACGGDFSELELIEQQEQVYTIVGKVSVAFNYCSNLLYSVFEIQLSPGAEGYELTEIAWEDY